VALDPLQDGIVRIALALPEARSLALAGGGAMLAHGFIDRRTRDIDLFTDRDNGEALVVVAALRKAPHPIRPGDRGEPDPTAGSPLRRSRATSIP
jgi:hypothetical protein